MCLSDWQRGGVTKYSEIFNPIATEDLAAYFNECRASNYPLTQSPGNRVLFQKVFDAGQEDLMRIFEHVMPAIRDP